MKYQALGQTELRVSVLGFGASPLGGVFGAVGSEQARQAVRTALDLGINFFDVSPYYGATAAETALGQALAGVDRESYVLATKVGRYGESDFDFSPDRVRRSVDESLVRLGTDHVDLIQCHDIEFGDVDAVIEETLPALRELQVAGKARYIGVTGLPLSVLTRVASTNQIDTVLSYCRYTLQDRSLLGALATFAAHGVGVINASPFAMGALTTKGPPPWHPAPSGLLQRCRDAAELCTERGTDLGKVALQFAIDAPGVASTVVGSARPEHIQRNVAWMLEPIDTELVREIETLLSPVMGQTWPSGQPQNADPQEYAR